MAFTVTSSAFSNGAAIPIDYTCDGENRSPDLRWSALPVDAKSFALIMHDPDAPKGDFTHWTLFDIPAGTDYIEEGAAPRVPGTQGRNDFGQDSYGGPCPPTGHGEHRYMFDLYALDIDSLSIPAGSDRQTVEAAVRDHMQEKATLQGTYERSEALAA